MTTSAKPSVYETVTAKIVGMLETGVIPWQRPWSTDHLPTVGRPLRSNGEAYKGINVLVLWGAAIDAGYSSPYWFTFKQAIALKCCVRRGEKGTTVVYAATFKSEKENAKGETVESTIPFLKSYVVFNAEQIEGIPAEFLTAAPVLSPMERLKNADEFFRNVGPDLRHGGGRAYYNKTSDHVQMPIPESFRDVESYTATLAHEMIHWTMPESRCNRDLNGKRFGDEGYAMEELVAELGSAFLCADLGITPEVRPDHASYIASWIKVLKGDVRAIFTAASMAGKAVDWMSALQPNAVATEETVDA